MEQRLPDLIPRQFLPVELEDLEKSILDRFDKIVTLFPQNVAIRDTFSSRGPIEISYRTLNGYSNSLSMEILETLRLKNLEPGNPIVLLFSPGYLAYISQLAVLKCGLAYTFLDADLPLEKLANSVATLRSHIILCGVEYYSLAEAISGRCENVTVLNVDAFPFEESGISPKVKLEASSTACIHYTSGSTGEPLGVLISHRSLMNFVRSSTNYVHITDSDIGSQLCPIYSIASAADIWSIILNGATLMPYTIKKLGVASLSHWLILHKITLFNSVPTVFRLMLQFVEKGKTFTDMRVVRLGGDRLLRDDVELFKQYFGATCFLRLVYASLESLSATQYFVFHGSQIESAIVPIGHEMDNVSISLVDDELNEVAQGEIGEIVIKSKYMATGYLNNPELTNARFKKAGDDGHFYYYTRDLGYQDSTGCLHYVSRKDYQVKVYGKLVSLSEIEAALMGLPAITDVAVTSRAAGTEVMLVAFYTTSDGVEISNDDFRRFLAGKLSFEKMPKLFIKLEKLPLTKSNKLDRRELTKLLL